MQHQIRYARAGRRLTKAGVASIPIGLLVVAHLLYVAHYGLPPGASYTAQWLMVGPSYLLALIGLVLCVVAIIGQRRFWWLAIPGLLLNGLPLGVVALLIVRRYG